MTTGTFIKWHRQTFHLCSFSLLTRLSSRAVSNKTKLQRVLSFQPFWTKLVQTFYTIAGFEYGVSHSLGLMHCQKWSVDEMDKNNTEAHSLVQSWTIFNWLIPIICITIDWTYRTMRSTKIKDIRGQEKDKKDQKMVSRLPRFDDLF